MSEEIAEDALDLIEDEYEKLPVLVDPLKAMQQNQVKIHDFAENNIHVKGGAH